MRAADIEALAGEPVASVTPLGGGRNSRSCKVILASGAALVAKWYPSLRGDPRDRVGTEFDSFAFLRRHGLDVTPAPLAVDRERRMALYEFVAGSPLNGPDAARHLDAFSAFARALHGLNRAAPGEWTRPASDASLTSRCLVNQIASRLTALEALDPGEPGAKDLHDFLAGEFAPLHQSILHAALAVLEPQGSPTALERSELTLSPSDFGFHNAILRADGQVAFLDFEYFGLDDPAKLIADFLLHPAMALDEPAKRRFLAAMLGSFGNASFTRRFASVYLLTGLKWCMIMLNEFSPAGLARRRLASPLALETASVRTVQLTKARAMLELLADHHRSIPYDLTARQ